MTPIKELSECLALDEGAEKKINPPAVVKAWAKKIGMPFKEAHKRWKKAEELAKKKFKQPKITKRGVFAKTNPKYWQYVMGIYKTMMYQNPGQKYVPQSEGFLQSIVDYLLGKKKKEPKPKLQPRKKGRVAFLNKLKVKSISVDSIDDKSLGSWLKSISTSVNGTAVVEGSVGYIEVEGSPNLSVGIEGDVVFLHAYDKNGKDIAELCYDVTEIRTESSLFTKMKAVSLKGRKIMAKSRNGIWKYSESDTPKKVPSTLPDARHAVLALAYTTGRTTAWNKKEVAKRKRIQAQVKKKFPEVYAKWLSKQK